LGLELSTWRQGLQILSREQHLSSMVDFPLVF